MYDPRAGGGVGPASQAAAARRSGSVDNPVVPASVIAIQQRFCVQCMVSGTGKRRPELTGGVQIAELHRRGRVNLQTEDRVTPLVEDIECHRALCVTRRRHAAAATPRVIAALMATAASAREECSG